MALWAPGAPGGAPRAPRPRGPPQHLRETGLYADFHQRRVSPHNLEYSPQYPLWTDGALKRRWIHLPPGTAINGARPDAWVFPVGTKFWKEFSFQGRRVETRYMERQANGAWLYATYAWNAEGSQAQLVSERGQPGAHELGGGLWHHIPSVSECRICHQGQRTEVLGFSALQLSPERDPNAVHAEPPPAPGVDLAYLVEHRLLRRFPPALLQRPPRIRAATSTERAVLGYLHGNCGHCHNDEGALSSLAFSLKHALGADPAEPERAIATAVGQPVQARASGQSPDALLRIHPKSPGTSVVLQRMASRYAALQMPPLGTVLLDEQALALLSGWIAEGPTSPVRAREPSEHSPRSSMKEAQ